MTADSRRAAENDLVSRTRELYVGAAVTEIATLRSELLGAYQG